MRDLLIRNGNLLLSAADENLVLGLHVAVVFDHPRHRIGNAVVTVFDGSKKINSLSS